MSDLLFYDAAFPPASKVAGTQDGVAFYIGGDTPHVWTKAEIDSQNVRFRLPIFVRSNPPGPGAVADVSAAVAQLKLIGAPRGILVAWDMEISADASYIAGVYGLMLAAGYKLIVYGSQNFVMGNDNPDGLYWGAQWTNVEHIATGDQMTQYISLAGYDESEALSTLPFWDTRPLTPPPAMPDLPGNWPHGFFAATQDVKGVLTFYGIASDTSVWLIRHDPATNKWSAPFKIAAGVKL